MLYAGYQHQWIVQKLFTSLCWTAGKRNEHIDPPLPPLLKPWINSSDVQTRCVRLRRTGQ